jgi:hypothetical protein
MWENKFHTHKTTGKINVLHTLIFIFLDSKHKHKKTLDQMVGSILLIPTLP